MTIQWFDATKALPTVTVATYGLNLNTSAAEYFKGSEKLKLGLEAEKKKIYLKASSGNDEGGFSFPEIGDKTKTARVSCREFIQYVMLNTGLDFNQSEKFYSTWDENEQIMIIDLNKKLSRPKKANSTRGGSPCQ